MAKYFGFTSLTGGGTGALDAINGSVISVGDIAVGADSTDGYTYVVDGSGDLESAPNTITPDNNAGVKRWKRRHDEQKAYRASAPTNGHMASVDADGDVVDSGKIAADVIDKAAGALVTGNVVQASGNARIVDSGQTPVSLLSGRKNIIINGGFEIWQRGTSLTGISAKTYLPDRFFWNQTGAGSIDISQSSDVPTAGSFTPNYSWLLDVNTIDGAIAAGDNHLIQQVIEGFDYRKIKTKTVTLSFWVKSNKTGIYCVSFRNSGNDRSYVVEYTISVADTWEKKTITLTLNPTGGTDDFTNGSGLKITWALSAGTDFHTTAGAWQTGNFIATSNQVNFMDTNTNTLRIALVQFEVGSVATEFEVRHFISEILMCKRYFEKSFAYSTTPASAAGIANAARFGQIVGAGVANQTLCTIIYSVDKRDAPTVTTYNPSAAGAQVRNITTATDCTAVAASSAEKTTTITYTTAAGSAAGQQNGVHWTADAEL